MKRVNTRGIKQANKCMLMAAVAYNIKKMMKFQNSKPMAAVAWLTKQTNPFAHSLFFLLNSFIQVFADHKSKISIA